MKSAVKIPLLLLPGILLSGCVTSQIVTRKDITLKDLPGALVLDTVVTPILAIQTAKDSIGGDKPRPTAPPIPAPRPPTLTERIEADPEVIFREGLQRRSDPATQTAIYVGLRDTKAPVTADQLSRLYREMPGPPTWILSDPRCSEALLRDCFTQARNIRFTRDHDIVQSLVYNHATPRDILTAIAADPKRYGKFSLQAQQRLNEGPGGP